MDCGAGGGGRGGAGQQPGVLRSGSAASRACVKVNHVWRAIHLEYQWISLRVEIPVAGIVIPVAEILKHNSTAVAGPTVPVVPLGYWW